MAYLIEGVRLDLRELVLHVIGVHGANLLTGRGAEHLDDFHQLVDTRLTREERLAQHQFGHHTTSRPHIYGGISHAGLVDEKGMGNGE